MGDDQPADPGKDGCMMVMCSHDDLQEEQYGECLHKEQTNIPLMIFKKSKNAKVNVGEALKFFSLFCLNPYDVCMLLGFLSFLVITMP